MRMGDASKILFDIQYVCNKNNDDPIIVAQIDGVLKPIKKATYMVINGGDYINLWTDYGYEDDSVILSQLIEIVKRVHFPFEEIRIDFSKSVKSIKIDMIDQIKVVVVEAENENYSCK